MHQERNGIFLSSLLTHWLDGAGGRKGVEMEAA